LSVVNQFGVQRHRRSVNQMVTSMKVKYKGSIRHACNTSEQTAIKSLVPLVMSCPTSMHHRTELVEVPVRNMSLWESMVGQVEQVITTH
jgi:hypothetical protein